MAMLSYSNFGADQEQVGGTANIVSEAVAKLHRDYPEYVVDGEMQVNFALNKELRDHKYRFTKLKDKNVNTLIFPCLSSANTTYKMLLEMGVGESIGPIQMGLNKPIHFTDVESSVRDIFNLTVAAVIDAIVQEKKDAEKK
jgi:malate dehydrogenase (oxaloacetate-decarboxylating)(NADP+)